MISNCLTPNRLTKSVFLLVVSLYISCSDTLEVIPNTSQEIPDLIGKKATDQELEKIAQVLVEFINQKNVRNEILSFATEEKGGEVNISFKEIFSSVANGKSFSPFADNFRKTLSTTSANARTVVDETNFEEILTEDYYLYAPYFAEYHADSEKPISITWFNGVDTNGETLGIVSQEAGSKSTSKILVTDEYAQSHPTLVLMPFDDDAYMGELPLEQIDEYSSSKPITYTFRDIDCRDLNEDNTVLLRMPEFRLTDNTRAWPWPNVVYIWAISADYTMSPNEDSLFGSLNQSYIGEKEVSRANARDKKWIQTPSPIATENWKPRSTNLKLVALHRKGHGKTSVSGSIGIDTNGIPATNHIVDFNINKRQARALSSVTFDRCATLATLNSDGGYGLRNGSQIFRFGRMEFYFEVDIR